MRRPGPRRWPPAGGSGPARPRTDRGRRRRLPRARARRTAPPTRAAPLPGRRDGVRARSGTPPAGCARCRRMDRSSVRGRGRLPRARARARAPGAARRSTEASGTGRVTCGLRRKEPGRRHRGRTRRPGGRRPPPGSAPRSPRCVPMRPSSPCSPTPGRPAGRRAPRARDGRRRGPPVPCVCRPGWRRRRCRLRVDRVVGRAERGRWCVPTTPRRRGRHRGPDPGPGARSPGRTGQGT